ncbi:hypothetical protein C1645_841295 [Glomus cerebriforme]|uniref:Uncharacterized protein n=1 Tax=Glomus cerebriforme TaxID=658196 RepID=A0A397S2M0_9GLOM|nr:hypothetical protein C1645_848864 [Glomus cerebriforme]RIA79199.1 hypothetical protein C1645_841295 [Glomus cerebriforme]
MNYFNNIFFLGLLFFLISRAFADCDFTNTSGCTCVTGDPTGGLECGHELTNNCPSDPGSLFLCNITDQSICRFTGGCIFGCCATGDGNSKCCVDAACSGCTGTVYQNLAGSPPADPNNPNSPPPPINGPGNGPNNPPPGSPNGPNNPPPPGSPNGPGNLPFPGSPNGPGNLPSPGFPNGPGNLPSPGSPNGPNNPPPPGFPNSPGISSPNYQDLCIGVSSGIVEFSGCTNFISGFNDPLTATSNFNLMITCTVICDCDVNYNNSDLNTWHECITGCLGCSTF